MPEAIPLQLGIEFHDSEVASAEASADELLVRFSAACVHVSRGGPGVGAGSVYAQAVELAVAEPSILASLDGCLGRVSDGELVIAGEARSMLPVPFEHEGPVTLTLIFANGSRITATGNAARARQRGEPRLVEHFHC